MTHIYVGKLTIIGSDNDNTWRPKLASSKKAYTISTDHMIRINKIQLFTKTKTKFWMKIKSSPAAFLTHWGRVTHNCISNATIIRSDNVLLLGRCQAIIWTNAEILLIGPMEANFIEILINIHTYSFQKMHLKMSSGKWRPFCLCLNVSKTQSLYQHLINC